MGVRRVDAEEDARVAVGAEVAAETATSHEGHNLSNPTLTTTTRLRTRLD